MTYKIKKKGVAHKTKLSFFCPHCQRITGTIDDAVLREYGFCKTCFVMYVEDRSTPAIDLEKYRPSK
jgi:hypothetical protein